VPSRQSPLDEYQVVVHDVSRDLRDGVILSFLAKARAGVDVLSLLRVPATSRVHKLANVAKLLNALEGRGLDLDTGRRGKVCFLVI